MGFSGGSGGKESVCQCRRYKRVRFYPWAGKIPRRRKWLPAPVFLPGESHGQRSLVGYSPWGVQHQVLDMTEQLTHTHTHTHTHTKCISLLSVNAKLKLCSEPSLKVLPQGLLFLMASEWRRVSGGRRRSAASSGRLVPGSTEVWSVSSARLGPCTAAPADRVPPASDGEVLRSAAPHPPQASSSGFCASSLGREVGGKSEWVAASTNSTVPISPSSLSL